jgi:tetratricopeptide (TPR) repeat protein
MRLPLPLLPRPRPRRSPARSARAGSTRHSPTAITRPTPRSTTATPRRRDRAVVANLIGYSYRKLGDYQLSQVWYERALKADPDHVKTWQYYGLWQLEQGNREQAECHLSKIALLAGTDSEEYRSLAAALAQPPGTGLVY